MQVENVFFWLGVAFALLGYVPALVYAIAYYAVLASKRSQVQFLREVAEAHDLKMIPLGSEDEN